MKNPTYEDVCTNSTGHAEVVQIEYDNNKITYEGLLEIFWKIHDPAQLNRQGADIGSQYRSAIFYHNEAQKEQAIKSKEKHQNQYKNKIVTEIKPSSEFWRAEEYHQKYFEKTRNQF